MAEGMSPDGRGGRKRAREPHLRPRDWHRECPQPEYLSPPPLSEAPDAAGPTPGSRWAEGAGMLWLRGTSRQGRRSLLPTPPPGGSQRSERSSSGVQDDPQPTVTLQEPRPPGNSWRTLRWRRGSMQGSSSRPSGPWESSRPAARRLSSLPSLALHPPNSRTGPRWRTAYPWRQFSGKPRASPCEGASYRSTALGISSAGRGPLRNAGANGADGTDVSL